ncbi:MAG: hypothetical protein PHV59_01625 [Victivallales bacterium]|nr:hypothetical protein [Victivallales bacterium]
MKKMFFLIGLFATVLTFGEEKQSWETRPGIFGSGNGYNDTEGAWIYAFYQEYSCPSSLPFDYSYYYVNNHQAIINIGYGDFRKYGGGSLISSDTQGEILKDADESWALTYTTGCQSGDGGGPGKTIAISESDRTGKLANAYIYKRTEIQKMSASFGSSSYTASTGEDLGVTVVVSGGSGYWGISTTKPSFLETEDKGVYSGKSYQPLTCSISAVVTDLVTGQSIGISADIKITEDDGSSDSDDSSGSSSSPSDPGGTAADPGSGDSDDDGTSADSGDNSGGDDSAVDPGSDDDSEPEPDDPGSDDDENEDKDSTDNQDDSDDEPAAVTDPESNADGDEPVDPGSDNDDDDSSDDSDGDNDDSVTVIPDNTDEPADPGNDDSSDSSNGSDSADEAAITDPADSGSDGANETTVIVVNNDDSATETIIVTDDSVTTERSENYDLAVFMGMFGAITGMNGSVETSPTAPQAAKEAYQREEKDDD